MRRILPEEITQYLLVKAGLNRDIQKLGKICLRNRQNQMQQPLIIPAACFAAEISAQQSGGYTKSLLQISATVCISEILPCLPIG